LLDLFLMVELLWKGEAFKVPGHVLWPLIELPNGRTLDCTGPRNWPCLVIGLFSILLSDSFPFTVTPFILLPKTKYY
jgi:hypothetical protein